jgi:hypothetical protein
MEGGDRRWMSLNPSFIRWNIFARELELILARRKLRLGHLDNRKDELGPLVHPEKVRRLQRSLYTPKILTTLNPDELQRVVRAFGLTPEEEARLHAALLATAVEMLLMDRVDAHTALLAADETFHTLLAALQQEPPPPGISSVREPAPFPAYTAIPAMDYSEALAEAVDRRDRATLALHLSEVKAPPHERKDWAEQAHNGYVRVLTILEQTPATADDGAARHGTARDFWREQAAQGKTYAAQQLLALQGEPGSRA